MPSGLTLLAGLMALSVASASVSMAGVNIAGCDFGCDINGTCLTQQAECPTLVGPLQMAHFANTDGFNLFRLPVPWQSLVNNNLGGSLDPLFLVTYDALVASCLATGAHCIIDIHNYARWNGAIIGQSYVTNDDFVSLWSQLAAWFSKDKNVIFGIMNEPHDLDMSQWTNTVQLVVNAIRAAGATSQYILLPGTDYTNAAAFPSESTALLGVQDSDKSTNKLIFDVHQYYDASNTGTETECSSNNLLGFEALHDFLKSNGRRALLSETGGGNTASCEEYVCQALGYINQHNDQFMGYAGWAAGSFASSYNLTEVPVNGQDTSLVQKCISGVFGKSGRA